MKLKTSGLRKILTVAVSLLLMLVTGAAFLSLKGFYRAAASENSLLYRLNFENDADIGKNSAGTEFADAILPEGNSFTVEEGVKGVSSAADSTQVLVGDMESITHHMDENQHIAADLKKETEIFKKL